eukprot:s2761_g12.t1
MAEGRDPGDLGGHVQSPRRRGVTADTDHRQQSAGAHAVPSAAGLFQLPEGYGVRGWPMPVAVVDGEFLKELSQRAFQSCFHDVRNSLTSLKPLELWFVAVNLHVASPFSGLLRTGATKSLQRQMRAQTVPSHRA